MLVKARKAKITTTEQNFDAGGKSQLESAHEKARARRAGKAREWLRWIATAGRSEPGMPRYGRQRLVSGGQGKQESRGL